MKGGAGVGRVLSGEEESEIDCTSFTKYARAFAVRVLLTLISRKGQ